MRSRNINADAKNKIKCNILCIYLRDKGGLAQPLEELALTVGMTFLLLD